MFVIRYLPSQFFSSFQYHSLQVSFLVFSSNVFSGLSFPVFKGVMKKGYKLPTPIQRKVLDMIFFLAVSNPFNLAARAISVESTWQSCQDTRLEAKNSGLVTQFQFLGHLFK